jgi:plastocyanin
MMAMRSNGDLRSRVGALVRRNGIVVLAALALAGAGVAAGYGRAPAASPAYKPQVRSFTVTMIPLQVHEMQKIEPFLAKDFAKGGVLSGKEVYGMYPGTLIVYQGDTVHLTVVNPEDDAHTISFPDQGVTVTVAGQSTAQTTFIAKGVGAHTFMCVLPEHYPYMWGQIVVLPGRDAL